MQQFTFCVRKPAGNLDRSLTGKRDREADMSVRLRMTAKLDKSRLYEHTKPEFRRPKLEFVSKTLQFSRHPGVIVRDNSELANGRFFSKTAFVRFG
jgi:hypothetical protein